MRPFRFGGRPGGPRFSMRRIFGRCPLSAAPAQPRRPFFFNNPTVALNETMIGIFDSGIGGLTVVRALMQKLPEYDLVYFGDTARTPYGNKSPETVIAYSRQNTAFLLDQGVRMVIMACNTASSLATAHIAADFDAPIFEVITPAVDRALQSSRRRCFGVIATRATVDSGIYESQIKQRCPSARVHSAACPLLVPLVEEGWLKNRETAMIVKKYLLPLKMRQIDTLILGCTHYPLLKPVIQRKIGRQVGVIDSSEALAEHVQSFLTAHPEVDAHLGRGGKRRFYVSDLTGQFEWMARRTLKQNVTLKTVRI